VTVLCSHMPQFFLYFLFVSDRFRDYMRKKMTPFRIAVEKGIKCDFCLNFSGYSCLDSHDDFQKH